MNERQNGPDLRVIARCIQRSTATISRKLNRTGCRSVFDRQGVAAEAEAWRQRRRCGRRKPRLKHGSVRYQCVHDRLVYFPRSPQQLASGRRYLAIDARPGLVFWSVTKGFARSSMPSLKGSREQRNDPGASPSKNSRGSCRAVARQFAAAGRSSGGIGRQSAIKRAFDVATICDFHGFKRRTCHMGMARAIVQKVRGGNEVALVLRRHSRVDCGIDQKLQNR